MDKARESFHELLLHEADAALDLSHSDIRTALQDELGDMFPGEYAYLRDVFGDSEAGECVYCCGNDTWKAPYEIGTVNGKRTCAIDDESAVEVIPHTVYDEQADDSDHYTSMGEAFKASKIYTELPLYERFISKKERDSMSSGDFAGKNKSFPIKNQTDLDAAFHSIGRAGSDNYSSSVIRANIIKIGKRKGLKLPKSVSDTSSSEAAKEAKQDQIIGELKLCESATTLEAIVLKEARADYPIKLIAPGKGASAFYPKEVLQRDGPKVFKAGTHIYLNHPTSAEEASRPEGDVKNLAGVLTTAAEWQESGAKGPGLYGRMKVFADHGQMVEEKAPHVGMSIRAGGIAESGKTRDGLPILKELTHAESVDIVTRAGAGGMILTESAGVEQLRELLDVDETAKALDKYFTERKQEADMTAEEAKKMLDEQSKAYETRLAEAVKPFRERAVKGDARDEATKLLESVTLPAEAKVRIIERAIANIPMTDKGEVDLSKFRETVVAEAKSEGEYLAKVTGSGRVFGNGSSAGFSETKPDKKALKEARKEQEEEMEHAVSVYQRLGLSEAGAKAAAKGRVA